MKISEAREIVGKMIYRAMRSQGIELDEKPKPITEDLQTLLKANKIVEMANKRALKKMGKHKIGMTIADRGIAALYVAIHFAGDNPRKADFLSMYENNIVVCLDSNYIQNEEEEE